MDIATLHKYFLASTGITTDTRNIKAGSIFFALKGDKFNANLFAIEALNKGAAYAVIDELQKESETYQDRLILVPDALSTLQELSAYHRQQLRCPVLGITGSNGKTTTKELIAAVISTRFRTTATAGNLNNHIGVPLTLLSAPLDTEFLIVEMGANHQKEIAGYCTYADPDYGLITNIGKAHLEGFGGEEGVVKGKTELYAHIAKEGGKLFVSSISNVLVKKANEFIPADHIIYYGDKRNGYCSAHIIEGGEFVSLQISDGLAIKTQLIGNYNFENVLAAICIGRYFGITDNNIKTAIENYIPSNNRSQKLTIGSNTILLDAYNANPSSMTEALKNFDKLNATNKITILGEMMELGSYSEVEHLKIIETVEQMDLSQRIFVGDGFKMLKGQKNSMYFENTADLKSWYHDQHLENTTQLIKGSRKNALEQVIS